MDISIEALENNAYRVRVEAGSITHHTVTARPEYLARLVPADVDAEAAIRASFEFLMQHESNQSILSSFDLSVIQRYFPSYESTMQKRFGAA